MGRPFAESASRGRAPHALGASPRRSAGGRASAHCRRADGTASAPGRTRALLAFAGFGGFWGAWGAELPAVQSHAGVGDGALGLALLCIGAGALASMRPTGVLVDRRGARVTPLALLAFAVAGVGPALAGSALALALAMLLLGAASARSTCARTARPPAPNGPRGRC